MRKIDDLRSGDTREEIFIASGKSHHFMRKYRSTDDDLVILIGSVCLNGLVHHGKVTFRDLTKLFFSENSNLGKRFRLIPLMIEDLDTSNNSVFYLPIQPVYSAGYHPEAGGFPVLLENPIFSPVE